MTRAEQLIARLYTARKERWEEKQKMKGKSFLFDSGWADYRQYMDREVNHYENPHL